MGDDFGWSSQYRCISDWRMKFTVRYKINQYDVCDEDEKLVSMIQKGALPGKSLVVCDADRKR